MTTTTNAISVLKTDHSNVEELFHRFEGLGDDAAEEKARIRDKVIEHLSVHGELEEQVLYPAIRAKDPEQDDLVLEALEEHHMMKLALSELEKVQPGHERFDAKFTVLMENVRHHIQEEEDDLFPKVREMFTVEELNDLGRRIEELRPSVPTRPHPFSPDQPPFNTLIGLPVAILDRAVTTGKETIGKLLSR
jgi:hemerythrin superfamily protein